MILRALDAGLKKLVNGSIEGGFERGEGEMVSINGTL